MDKLRLPPYPLEIDVPVPLPLHSYSVAIDGVSEAHISDANNTLSVELADEFARYDSEYSLTVTDTDVVVEDTLRVARPYVDVKKVYPDKDFDEYSGYEQIARLAIDNIVGGFYYKKKTFERMGTGSDVLPLGYPVRKLLSVAENGEPVFDGTDNFYEYVLSDNYLYMRVASTEDIIEGSPVVIPTGRSDTWGNPTWGVQFGGDYVYTITAEVGYPVVPLDIQTITKRMIEQLACKTPNYLQKYIVKYETKEYRVDFDKRAFDGTGDLLVDQTLRRYWGRTIFSNIGVL